MAHHWFGGATVIPAVAMMVVGGSSSGGGGGSFDVLDLFASGEQGMWFDPSDFTTMFQDAAGTVPVTATGQSVGLIKDKSGNAKDASQSTSGNRPVLQQDGAGKYYLQFDGLNDFLSNSSVSFTATDKLTIFAGVSKSDDNTSIVVELSSTFNSNDASFLFVSGADGSFKWDSAARGSAAGSSFHAAGVTTSAPDLAVITASHDISGSLSRLRRNGTFGTDGTASKGTGNFGSYPLFIGARNGASLFWSGRLYGLIIRGASCTGGEILDAETFMNGMTAAY